MAKLWVVRSNGGELIPLFFEHNIVAIGWCPNINFENKDKSFIKKEFLKEYPGSEKSIPAWVGFFENFINVMKPEDYVLTYDSSLRLYYLGKVKGNYIHNTFISEDFSHMREVEWFKEKPISRDFISTSTKNSLGSPQTLFKISTEQTEEILNIFNANKIIKESTQEIKEENKEFSETLIENSKESLKDAIQSLTPDEMEELVKEILNAMGYIAKRSKKGKDRACDVFASPDGFGLEEPRIFVEVKHQKGKTMGAPEVRSFIGGRQCSDKCLYVSTGGFTQEAKYEAERSSTPLTLIDIEELANIISIYYDKFSVEGRMLLPLRKVYIPALRD